MDLPDPVTSLLQQLNIFSSSTNDFYKKFQYHEALAETSKIRLSLKPCTVKVSLILKIILQLVVIKI